MLDGRLSRSSSSSPLSSITLSGANFKTVIYLIPRHISKWSSGGTWISNVLSKDNTTVSEQGAPKNLISFITFMMFLLSDAIHPEPTLGIGSIGKC